MADCPICGETLDLSHSEWISDCEEMHIAECPKCEWRGTATYVSTIEYWDERTKANVPTDFDGFKAWREENSKYYNVQS